MDAILSLGSNLGDRLAHLVRAREALAHLPQTRLVASSRVYVTEPVDVPRAAGGLEFFNAIVVLETRLEVHAFSEAAHAIEDRMGRTRTAERNAPRAMDIDLICCDGLQLDEPALQLPHPRAHLRRFVCEPLAELRPTLVLPGQHLPVRELLSRMPHEPIVSVAVEQW
ncbi:MAG: 2-amino-4-hydroxy-6-hydroxymethyldihydropteridine diphosphokinase [bacterium]